MKSSTIFQARICKQEEEKKTYFRFLLSK